MTLEEFLDEWHGAGPTVRVKTSGSTGAPKPMDAEKSRMEASARATCRFLGLKRGDSALLCLPLDYIAGKMMVVRAVTCGLRLVCVRPSSHPLAGLASAPDFAAMTPMQVWETLRVEDERETLSQIGNVIIGGGAVDKPLAAALQEMRGAVWSTYGMTETLSHIAMRRINGPEASEWYTPFDGVTLGLDERGCLTICAPAVCATKLTTNDMAELRPRRGGGQEFRIAGRADNVICSGGIKIQAEEVERRLEGHLGVPFMVTWRRDERLGQAVALVLEGGDPAEAKKVCEAHLPRHWTPRHIETVERLPRTETGKVRRTPPTTP